MELLSKKQIQVISDFGCYRYRIHVGPYGCGKSYGLSAGFGLKLRATKPGKLGYLIVAKTASLAKSTIGDELSNLFVKRQSFKNNLTETVDKSNQFSYNGSVVKII